MSPFLRPAHTEQGCSFLGLLEQWSIFVVIASKTYSLCNILTLVFCDEIYQEKGCDTYVTNM